MNINERFQAIIDSEFKGNKRSFAKAIGVSPTVIENVVGTRKGKPSFDVLSKVCAIENISERWLLTGQGNMLKEASNTSRALIESVEKDTLIDYRSDKLNKYTPGAIPLVSAQAVGGFAGSDFSINDNDVLAYYVIPSFQNKGIDFMIRITGDSMAPRLWGGDIVACSIVHNPSFIQWNKTYLLSTRNEGLIVKRLRKSDSPGCLLAISNNPDYDPFDIPKDEILGLARVVGVIHLE